MSLQDTKTRIEKNMLHSSYLSNILRGNRLIIPKFLEMAINHFDIMENDGEVIPTDDDLFVTTRVLDLCKMIVIEVPVTDALRELINDLCLLIHNWNSNTVSSAAIETDIKFITNAVDMHFTLIELIKFTKAVVREASKKNVTSSVRTDEISRHFLLAIDALGKEKACDENICSES